MSAQKGDPTFGSAKTAVNELLQELLAEVKAQAAKAQQSILSLKGQHQPLLAEGKASIERRIAQADEQYRAAKTYSDFVTFLKLPESITLELRVAEKQFQTKMQSDAALAASKRAQKERAEESARKDSR